MRTLRAWLLRIGGLFGKERREHELAEEIASHLQMHVEDNLRSGMSPVAARRAAPRVTRGANGVRRASPKAGRAASRPLYADGMPPARDYFVQLQAANCAGPTTASARNSTDLAAAAV
jgi:hypothetical protein